MTMNVFPSLELPIIRCLYLNIWYIRKTNSRFCFASGKNSQILCFPTLTVADVCVLWGKISFGFPYKYSTDINSPCFILNSLSVDVQAYFVGDFKSSMNRWLGMHGSDFMKIIFLAPANSRLYGNRTSEQLTLLLISRIPSSLIYWICSYWSQMNDLTLHNPPPPPVL